MHGDTWTMSSQRIAGYAINPKMAFTSGRVERYDEAENLHVHMTGGETNE